jgi:hypothetical protein
VGFRVPGWLHRHCARAEHRGSERHISVCCYCWSMPGKKSMCREKMHRCRGLVVQRPERNEVMEVPEAGTEHLRQKCRQRIRSFPANISSDTHGFKSKMSCASLRCFRSIPTAPDAASHSRVSPIGDTVPSAIRSSSVAESL